MQLYQIIIVGYWNVYKIKRTWKNRILTTIINTITLARDQDIQVEAQGDYNQNGEAVPQLVVEMYILLMKRFYHRIEKACTTFSSNDINK